MYINLGPSTQSEELGNMDINKPKVKKKMLLYHREKKVWIDIILEWQLLPCATPVVVSLHTEAIII